jgi:chitinase
MSCLSRWSIFVVLFLPAALVGVITASSALAQDSPSVLPKRIVADYGYWSKSQDPPYSWKQIPYRMLTHINHAGVSFNADGSLSVPGGFLEPELNEHAHDAGVKVLLLLGGDFNGLEATGAVDALVGNIAAYTREHDYDGVDMDWEYPATTEDRNFLVKLMKALRESNSNYTLSIDIPPWGVPVYDPFYDLKDLQRSLDYFNIMMYDCAGPWDQYGQLNSPIFWDSHDPAPWECQPGGSVQEAADYFLKYVPARQLNMGTPFYGYYYTAINQLFAECPARVLNNPNNGDTCGNSVLTLNYANIKPLINRQGWYTLYDPIALVPYMVRVDGRDGYITYDDPFSTFYRVWYSDWKRGLGGTFMWALDEDYDGHSQDLLDAMYLATVTGH